MIRFSKPLLLASGAFAFLLCGHFAAGQTAGSSALTPAVTPYIDAHTHAQRDDPEGSVRLVLQAMKGLNGAKAIILMEPYGPNNPDAWEAETILPAAKKYPDKIAVLGGGGSLNEMILESSRTGDAGPDVQRRFRARAEELLRGGVAGFGELSTEHFSLPTSPVKDYEYAPADSPLMLLLADIAAEHNVPIDLHMEAVPRDMPAPAGLKPPNPPQLHGNFAALERLLAHNPRAKLVWAHAGADNTGYRSPELMRPLLQRHPNLYMEIKYDPNALGKNPPIGPDGKLKPEWLKLYEDFPDRFLIGSDQHYEPSAHGPLTRAQANALLLNQLSVSLRQKIGMENPLRLYHFGG